ncbi:MAG: bifunctional metallophosphatase/5'-nucleotidase [Chitinophagaceae bacterium]
MNRRIFIREVSFAAAALLAEQAHASEPDRHLTILHTNDVHSRLDPFEDGAFAGKGGVAARSSFIQKMRSEIKDLILVDGGDIFQGTPYFNKYKGEPELKAMSMMGYDAATIGNHDFDAGIDNLADKISQFANFPIINCNYDFSNTPMEYVAKPYHIISRPGLKVGVIGVGIELEGLVGKGLFGKTKYLDPVQKANEYAHYLKRKKSCDMIICLSHLGDKYKDAKVSDEVLAKSSDHIDFIVGAHTHQFFEEPRIYTNLIGKNVVVNQAGWGGVQIGKIDYDISKKKLKNPKKNYLIPIEKN